MKFSRVFRVLGVFVVFSMITGCSMPRGAALQSEITRVARDENPSFSVVPVSRQNVETLKTWPATGWHGHFHWLGKGKGSNSSIIQPGDRIDLTIWDSQDGSLLASPGETRVNMPGLIVSSSGYVFVPYAENVKVSGLTHQSARARIQGALSSFAPNAQVQLVPAEIGQSNSVDLVSGVSKPGTYPMPDRNFTILSLISQGGGISSSIKNPVIALQRGNSTYKTYAKRLFDNPSRNVVLRGKDRVIVSEDDRYFTALGATGSEKVVDFNREEITAIEALSMLGGISDTRANPKGILILREYKASQLRDGISGPAMQQVVFTIDLTSADGLFAARNFMINPKDTIMATESPITAARTIMSLIGSVIGLGNQVDNL